MAIKVRSLGGFETQGVRGPSCCGQRDGLGDPIMMLEGILQPDIPTGQAPPPDNSLFQKPRSVRTFSPARLPSAPLPPPPPPPADPPPGGAPFQIVADTGGGSGSSVPMPPLPATEPAPASDDGNIKIAIAAGGIMVAAALFFRGR